MSPSAEGYREHRTVGMISPALLCICIVAVVLVLGAPLSETVSDGSEAASEVPTIDVLTLEGESLSGKGAILDGTSLDFTAESEPGSPQVFRVDAGTVLVSGANYLLISGPSTMDFSLTGYMFGENDFVKDYGLRLSL